MSEVLTVTQAEKERIALFINEQREEWNREEQNKALLAAREHKSYEPQPFPGFSEEVALRAIRSGWKSNLDKMFERKARREGWAK